MRSGIRNSWNAYGDAAAIALLLLVGALLLLPRLGDRYLWQDEAATALLAESVLREGVPTAFDGRNLVSTTGQREFGEDHVWYWTPWLQHYLTAGSFALLGRSTQAARLPFVLLGLGCVVLVYLLALRIRGDRASACFAAVVLLASVPFLLHARQCRYYAAAAFFALLLLHQVVGSPRKGRASPIGVALAATGLLHAHYVVAAAFLAATALHAVLFARSLPHLRALLIGSGVAGLAFAPWGVRFAATAGGTALWDASLGLGSLVLALDHLDAFVIPFAFALPAAALGLARRRQATPHTERGVWLLVVCLVAVPPFLSLVMPDFFFRYYLPLVTPSLGELPGDVRYAMSGDEEPGRVVGAWASHIPLAAYLYELSHDVDGPLEAVVAHLARHGSPSDTLIATYGDLPLQFYTGMRVVGGGSEEDPTPHLDAEWILLRRALYHGGDVALRRALAERVDWSRYRRVPLGVPDVPFENRPDPHYHKYRTVTGSFGPIQLYRRNAETSPDAPNLLLISVDTLRADRLGCYAPEGVGSELCALFEGGTRYAWAFSSAPYTVPAVASLLTSRYPAYHGTHQAAASYLADRVTTVAETLRDGGYATAAFVSNPVLHRSRNFGQGFQRYDADMTRGEPNRPYLAEREAAETTDAALRWVAEEAHEPWFVWVHYQDPHGPYDPPGAPPAEDPPGARRLPLLEGESGRGGIPAYQALAGASSFEAYEQRYRDEIEYTAAHVVRLVEQLDAGGRPPAIFLAADHGEALGEDDYFFAHGHSLGVDQIRVPMLFRPAGPGESRVVDQPVSLVDVAPSLLRLAGLEAPAGFQGSCLPGVAEDCRARAPSQSIFAEHDRRAAVISRRRIYERDRDPDAEPGLRLSGAGSMGGLGQELAALPPRVLRLPRTGAVAPYEPGEAVDADLERRLSRFLEQTRGRRGVRHEQVPDEVRERMRALGYAID
jgi:arylsulfatase A-like enzyme